MNIRTKGIAAVFAALCIGTAFAEATIDKVVVRQNWPWSPDVKIEFALKDVSEAVDVGVTLKADGVTVPVTDSDIKGKRFGLTESGVYTLTVDTLKAFPKGNKIVSLQADVTVAPQSDKSQEVIYKIFDLADSKHAVTDVTRGALLNGEWGSVETDFGRIGPGYNTTLDDVIIWTGVTNDIAYKTTKLVLRKIPAGSFKGFAFGGTPPAANNMTWTNDYWMGVFELTQKQISLVGWGTDNVGMQSKWVTKGDACPAHAVNNWIMYNAGQTRSAVQGVTGLGFFHKLRNLFKDGDNYPYDFELPTVVQWNRACRAGTESYYYDGLPKPETTTENDQIAALGLYCYNGGVEGGVSNVVEVGSFRPNAYGLYDTMGNVCEILRDSGWNFSWNGGSNVTGKIGSTNDGYYYGGAFDSDGDDFATFLNNLRKTIHSANNNLLNGGIRVCMQDMAYGLQMVGK